MRRISRFKSKFFGDWYFIILWDLFFRPAVAAKKRMKRNREKSCRCVRWVKVMRRASPRAEKEHYIVCALYVQQSRVEVFLFCRKKGSTKVEKRRRRTIGRHSADVIFPISAQYSVLELDLSYLGDEIAPTLPHLFFRDVSHEQKKSHKEKIHETIFTCK